MKQFLSLSLLAISLTVAAPARADIPTYWVGSFESDTHFNGDALPGTVVVADAAAPKDAILVQPLDPDRFSTTVTAGEPGKYAASYAVSWDRVNYGPMAIVVDATAKPALIKNKKVAAAIKKLAVKSKVWDLPTTWQVGLADLDADGTADLALAYGCMTMEGDEDRCTDNTTLVFARKGKSWKKVKTPEPPAE